MGGKTARQFVQWTAEGGVATLVVDRPPLNALSYQAKEEIAACLEEVAADSAVRCLIVFGTGGRAFSVGSDIKEFPEVTARRLGRQRAVHEHAVNNRLDLFPVPTIAAIEGHCLGGGLELALACDLRVAGETSRLGLPEVTLGVFPAGGGTERLPRLIGEAHARELIYTGEPVDAREAWRIGLVNRVAPAGPALRVAQELGRTIASRPALTLRTVKAVMDRGSAMDLLAAEQIAIEAIGDLFQSEAVQEGVAAFLEKRPPRF
ncbi:MAG: enoyl-CoA hydratase/isomerase family protein [candidate division NC10 bacterium]|nr:enoyl-CoA hydratase/isomerase family protein [candidate division NC10 bacterium]